MLDHGISIIANPEGHSWDLACYIHNHVMTKVEEKYPVMSNSHDDPLVDLNPLKITYFQEGEFKTKITKNVRRRICVFIHDSNLHPAIWSKQLSLVNKSLWTSNPAEIINVLPYYYWARGERKNESRVPISAKDDGQNIEREYTRVITVDIHNDVMQGFFDYPFDCLPALPVLYGSLKKEGVKSLDRLVELKLSDFLNVVATGPDEGSIRRFRDYTGFLGIDLAMVDKYRKITGKLGESLGILGADKIIGRDVLMIDDLGASGGTLIRGSRACRNAGAKRVFMYVTHAMFNNGIDDVAKEFDLCLIGNTLKQPYVPCEGVVFPNLLRESLPQDLKQGLSDIKEKEFLFVSDILRQFPQYRDFKLPNNVVYISFDKTIAEAVCRNCIGESVSALFDLEQDKN